MFGTLKRFTLWTHRVKPEWAGFTVWISVVAPLYFLFILCICLIPYFTGWWGLGIFTLVVILYAWYFALFKQPKG